MDKPIIGITYGQRDDDEGIEAYAPYADAITAAGGEPRFLEPMPDASNCLSGIHGLLLTGGIDIHPDNYDSRNEPGDDALSTDELLAAYGMRSSLERDAYELSLARAGFEAGVPIFGICRGFQLLNVALGGSLVKDIRTGRKHWTIRKDEVEDGEPGESRKHMLTIVSHTKLAGILDDCPMLVNSRHHQGVMERHMSPRLCASAFAPDNIIEAIESPDHPWALAVQWHPERKKDDYVYESCKALFEEFISAAGRKMVDG